MSKTNKIKSVFANNKIPDFHKETIEEVSNRETRSNSKVVAAINGDFFSFKNGELEGFQVENSQIVYAHTGKVKYGINIDKKNRIQLDSMFFQGELKLKDASYEVTGVNTLKFNNADSSIILYDSHISFDSIQPKNQTLVLLKKIRKKYKFVKVIDGLPKSLNDNEYMLALNMPNTDQIVQQIIRQKKIKIQLDLISQTSKKPIKLASHLSGGVPLISDGIPMVGKQKNSGNYRGGIHPRTAVGVNPKDNTVVWMVVDGRSKLSKGIDYEDLSQLFLENDCTDAVNLDGGGSSAIWIEGDIKNNPSDKKGPRPCLNYLLLSN